MIFAVIILALIIFLYLCYLKTRFNENFSLNDFKWNNYRLGDIYYYWNNLNLQSKEWEYIDSINSLYPNSIGDLYLKKNNSKKENFNILKQIVNEKSKELKYKPTNNDIILHLRVGDSLKDFKDNKIVYFKNYATKLEDIEKNIDIFKNKNVLFFYGIHLPRDDDKKVWVENKNKLTDLYLDKVKDIFNKNNISFQDKSSGNPDLDFLMMCSGKTFIQSGGRYSNLIGKIVKSNNNKVIKLS